MFAIVWTFMTPKAHVLKVLSLAWCHWEVVGILRGGSLGGLPVIWEHVLEGDMENPGPSSNSFLCREMKALLCSLVPTMMFCLSIGPKARDLLIKTSTTVS